jgi:quinol monooxygenase YgiN
MHFHPEKVEEFIELFNRVKQKISSFEGCSGVDLLRETANGNIFFTYSKWKDEEALENYRKSELFAATWKQTKPLFKEKAEAWTVETVATA